ncbi:hypothetical protein GCK72_001855 [Caenorhabditis remanei]|uniref:Uncharacterized protein n=1 Tax=Caenorhabditis remanei TaxID=31234 RepID=E3LMV3_CAERE|nr:hypothetical protein GCK72_001855 [Caenorhabditis remanei]EFP03123.1 hypothetical protein CRE_28205 [Caenorhabditis remanei]KAF1770038.1 hypothetical protein GCK72_001855 [Caenorhabditis remanei]
MYGFKIDCCLHVCILILFITTIDAYPISSEAVMTVEDGFEVEKPNLHAHHHHHKHHIRHKHRRRSLTSDEDHTKTQRNKQVMLTKPYWPWP